MPLPTYYLLELYDVQTSCWPRKRSTRESAKNSTRRSPNWPNTNVRPPAFEVWIVISTFTSTSTTILLVLSSQNDCSASIYCNTFSICLSVCLSLSYIPVFLVLCIGIGFRYWLNNTGNNCFRWKESVKKKSESRTVLSGDGIE